MADNFLQPKTYPAKYAIIVIAVLGIGATVLSQWYYRTIQDRAKRLWGGTAANMIVNSPLAYVARFTTENRVPDGQDIQRLIIGGKRLSFEPPKEVSAAPGFSHLRQSLVNNSTFDWEDPKADCSPEWKYSLIFSDGEDSKTLLVAPDCRRIELLETGAHVTLQPLVMDGIDRFVREQLPVAAKPAGEVKPGSDAKPSDKTKSADTGKPGK